MQHGTAEKLARVGYAARGAVYLIVGGLAVLAALGGSGSAPDSHDALTAVLSKPFGAVLLGALAFGLACFALWRLAQAGLDADHHGSGAKALVVRAALAVSAIVNAGLAVSAVRLLVSFTGGQGGDAAAQDWTARLLQMPLGQWLVGAAGLAVVATGVATAWKGWKGGFMHHLAPQAGRHGWLKPMGRVGYLARGLVFLVAGGFLVAAALHANASEAKGLSGAMNALQEQPFGWLLFLVTAAGLFLFGAFQVVVACYRRIHAPDMGAATSRLSRQVRAA